MSHKDEGLKTRHRQYWKKIEADSVVLDPGIIAISWEDSTIRLHDGYTIGGRIFPMSPAPSLTVNVLTPLSGNGSVSSPIALNIAALANQVPVLANAPITGHGVTGDPLDLDLVALAVALANTVPVAHDASLVGNGTVGAPLSVNWGLAPQQPVSHNGTLSGNGTVASPLAVVPNALASLVAVSAISPITGDGKVATPLMLDVPAMLPQLHGNVAVITDGVTITGSGTTANPLVAVPTTPVVVTSAPITGNGTLASPIDINIVSTIAEIAAAGGVPAAHDGSLFGNGTTGNPLGVNWAAAPALNVQHDGSMTGQGTAGNPLATNWSAMPPISVQHDGTMTGSGTAGSPLSVNPLALANQVPVTVAAGLSGNGTTAAPIAPNPATLGPILAGYVPVAVSAPLSGTGTGASPLGIANATGASRGVVELATAAEGLQNANDVNATTPAYVALAIAAATIADATDTFRGKVALATAANYPQAANDIDATTPAYVAAAIAALPGEKFLQGLQSYNATTNTMTLLMNDGSTVAVDMTGLVADAVASVPPAPYATDTVIGQTQLAIGASWPTLSLNDTRSVTPLYVTQAIGNIPNASDTVRGLVALNIGTAGGDEINANDAVTITGVTALNNDVTGHNLVQDGTAFGAIRGAVSVASSALAIASPVRVLQTQGGIGRIVDYYASAHPSSTVPVAQNIGELWWNTSGALLSGVPANGIAFWDSVEWRYIGGGNNVFNIDSPPVVALPNATVVPINWPALGGGFVETNGTSSITVMHNGDYTISAGAFMNVVTPPAATPTNASGSLLVYLNGAVVIYVNSDRTIDSTGTWSALLSGTRSLHLSAGDVLSVRLFAGSGAGFSAEAPAGSTLTYFSAVRNA